MTEMLEAKIFRQRDNHRKPSSKSKATVEALQ